MQLLYYSFFHSKMLVVLTIEALKLALVLKISIKIFFVNNWLDFALYNKILADELEFQLKESSWHTMNNNNRLTANTTIITMNTTTITMAANTTTITRNNTPNNKQSNKLNNSSSNKHTNNNKKHNNKTNNIDWGVCGGGLRATPSF